MTELQLFTPSDALSDYIRYYLVGNVTGQGDLSSNWEISPGEMPALIFLEKPGLADYFAGDALGISISPIALAGPFRRRGRIQFCKQGMVIIVVFTVTGLFSFLGVKMSGIADKAVNGRDMIDDPGLFICRENIFNSYSPDRAIKILDEYFLRHPGKEKNDLRNMDKVVQHINSKKGNINIHWLAGMANMSVKTFERHFSEKIGLTPKLFCRMVRFAYARKMLGLNKGIFDIINDCGYSDQAHFIREFKFFAGRTPKSYSQGPDTIKVLINEPLHPSSRYVLFPSSAIEYSRPGRPSACKTHIAVLEY
jgi:AraC-like DNA-binding protein